MIRMLVLGVLALSLVGLMGCKSTGKCGAKAPAAAPAATNVVEEKK